MELSFGVYWFYTLPFVELAWEETTLPLNINNELRVSSCFNFSFSLILSVSISSLPLENIKCKSVVEWELPNARDNYQILL